MGSPPRATVRVSHDKQPAEEAEAEGDGPIDAAYAALERILPWTAELEEFDIHASSAGKDSVGEVHLQLRVAGRSFRGASASTDVVDAAVRAYLNAMDKVQHASSLEAQSFQHMELWGV